MPANLYGPGDNFDLQTSHLLPALIRKFHEAKGGGPVVLWGTGRPRREMLFVDDLARAMCLLLETCDWSGVPDGLLNIGVGDDKTIAELADLVSEVVGYDGPVEWDTSKPDGTPQKLMDVSRILKLGWSPKTELPMGIKQTYEWFLENRR
jgi:GDP-L-fucose synthase